MTDRTSRTGAALALMAASGFAGLGYQVVWTQQCASWLGHEAAAVLAVITAFFGGLALGAALAGRLLRRFGASLRFYALCEFTIAAWGGMLTLVLAPVGLAVARAAGTSPAPLLQWSLAFGATLLALLPATMAMGATLPAMQAVIPRLARGRQSVAALYAMNTAGAVIGTLAVTFVLAPRFGFRATALTCAGVNVACGVLAIALSRGGKVLMPTSRAAVAAPWALLVTGFLGIAYEVVAVRVLSQATEQTVYTFALLLAVYLVGSAGGAAAWHRSARSTARWRLSLATAAACAVGAGSLYAAGSVRAFVQGLLGPSQASALTAEVVLAGLAFGPASVAMGAQFAALAEDAATRGLSLGRALAFNLGGAALAPVVFGVVGIPWLGPKGSLVAICLGYAILAAAAPLRSARLWSLAGAVAATVAAFAPPLALVDRAPGSRLVSYRDGVTASVSVVEDADGERRLRIDNRQQEGSNATLRVDGRQAWLPLLLHPAPRAALFLGLGTGLTSGAAAEDPSLAVTAVELLPEVVRAAREFDDVFAQGTSDRRRIAVSDARRYVVAAREHYDVIVADNFHPARSGAGALYTVEHFRAVRTRLAADGLFCQWLPLHQLDLDTLRSIVASFLVAWPDAQALIANNGLDTPVIGLVGKASSAPFDFDALRARIARGGPPRGFAAYGLDDPFAVLGSFIAGSRELREFAGAAPLNTDDRPVVVWSAPRITYAPDSLPRDRLLSLVRAVAPRTQDVLGTGGDPRLAARLEAYWSARNRFLEAGRDVRPASDVRAMLAQVGAPLLAVLEISPDFTPASEPLLRMAGALERVDPVEASLLRSRIAAATGR